MVFAAADPVQGRLTSGAFFACAKKRDAHSRRGYSPWSLRDWPSGHLPGHHLPRSWGMLDSTPRRYGPPKNRPGVRQANRMPRCATLNRPPLHGNFQCWR